ncbi:MAG: PAS domain-containing protein [Deltaproteobacteria bacterium]|nr:PAS domain-containing protein [Deltaproteobacteria bacterium]
MKSKEHRFWIAVPPWVIVGAVAVLMPLFIIMSLDSINRQKAMATQLLAEKGDALIRSFEAGVRTGMGMQWTSFQLQKLLMETAQQPGIDYLIVTDNKGTILADSDPSQIGETYGTELDLAGISRSRQVRWRQIANPDGADTFEVHRRFEPSGEPFEGFREDWLFAPPPEVPPKGAVPEELIIFIGLDMTPLSAARSEDKQRTLWMTLIFLMIGVSGIISLLTAQGYRSMKISMLRIKALSDRLVETMPIGLLVIDAAGKISYINREAEMILQVSPELVLGKEAAGAIPQPLADLISLIPRKEGVLEKELECPISTGQTIPLEVIAATLREEDRPTQEGRVILFRDLTEMQHLKREVAKSQRLASLGSLAAGIAHEIRNPLSSIKGFATYFRQRYRDNPEDVRTAEIMIQEVNRLNRVIGQLLEFARPMNINLQPASLQAMIEQTVKMIEDQAAGQGVIIQTDLSPGVQDIEIDPDRMKQVLLNLCLNALEAMEEGGSLSIRLVQSDEKTIRIDVADTGTGIDKQDLARVFDPYYTTKPSGTGLGLAIVHRIVENHGGEVRLDSEPGRGTTASIFLPCEGATS